LYGRQRNPEIVVTGDDAKGEQVPVDDSQIIQSVYLYPIIWVFS
jgi:hypothetical protein